MQKKRLIRKRCPYLAVVAVLLFTGLLMAACLLDESGNGEGQGTLVAPLGGTPKNAPPVANNPPAGQPVVGNPAAETPVVGNPVETDNPPAEVVIEEPPVTDNPFEVDDPRVPFDPSLPLPEGYRYQRVLIYFTNAETLQFLTYEAKDFPEFNCVYIYSNFDLLQELAKAQYEAERTGVWSAELLARTRKGMLLNLKTYQYLLHLIVLEESEESFMRGIKLLEQRNGIQKVVYEWVEPDLKLPVYGAFEARGLDVQTEKQILQDWADNNVRIDLRPYFSSPESYFISYYGGTYNGSAVVRFNGNEKNNTRSFNFDGVFSILSFLPSVWNSGSFYDIAIAYDLGLLTADEIRGLPGMQITADENHWMDMPYCCYVHLDKKRVFDVLLEHEHDLNSDFVRVDCYWNPIEENYEH